MDAPTAGPNAEDVAAVPVGTPTAGPNLEGVAAGAVDAPTAGPNLEGETGAGAGRDTPGDLHRCSHSDGTCGLVTVRTRLINREMGSTDVGWGGILISGNRYGFQISKFLVIYRFFLSFFPAAPAAMIVRKRR